MLDFFKQHSHIFVIFDYEVLFNQGLENALGDFSLMIALALIILVFQIAWHMMSALFLIANGASNKTISMGLINPNVSAHSFWARVHSKKKVFQSFTFTINRIAV